ncbi:MAG: SDR family oxidoreductase [Chloroflexota bacterium]
MSQKVAVVTGAARGIGKAISYKLLQDEFSVVGADISHKGLIETAEEFSKAGFSFTPFEADLTSIDNVTGLFEQVAKGHSGLDVLVNNAGTCFLTDFVEISPAEFRQQMAINFDSAFYCCQKAIPLMLERPGIKKIVNISSNGAYNFEVFDPAHYRTSKAALDTLTKHLARQYANQGITVNSIAPAMTETDLFDTVTPDILEKAIAGMPHGKPMQPSEIAAWVSFLVSPAGDCSSGNVIILNQGRDVR